MDFMGIGPLEILVILVLAFLVFGPKKLPEIGANIGKTLSRLKKASNDLGKSINEEIKLEEMKEEKKEEAKQAIEKAEKKSDG